MKSRWHGWQARVREKQGQGTKYSIISSIKESFRIVSIPPFLASVQQKQSGHPGHTLSQWAKHL